MKRRTMGAVGIAAATTMMIAAPTAMAGTLSHTDVTVNGAKTPAGPVNVSGVNDGALNFTTFTLGTPMTCTSAAVDGNVIRGASVEVPSGSATGKIGEISDLLFSSCTATAFNYPVEVVSENAPWDIVVRSHPANAGDPVPITIEGITAYMHSVGLATPDGNPNTTGDQWPCELQATGDVDGIFYPGASGHDGRIEIDTNGVFPLQVTAFNGEGIHDTDDGSGGAVSSTCAAQVYTAFDGVDMTGDFDIDVNPASPGTNPISHS